MGEGTKLGLGRVGQGHVPGITKSRCSGANRRRGREAREMAGSSRERRRDNPQVYGIVVASFDK